jgi:hypothetical protein
MKSAEIAQETGSRPDTMQRLLPALAYYSGARVRTRPLDGCEARIIGVGNQAIITVNAHSPPRRKRFSIAHELGHWKALSR